MHRQQKTTTLESSQAKTSKLYFFSVFLSEQNNIDSKQSPKSSNLGTEACLIEATLVLETKIKTLVLALWFRQTIEAV